MNKKYDVIVVGAGFAGATLANLFAEENKEVLILEKRAQIGGNMYDYLDENGVLVHKYGPHIFHTNYKEVFDYLQKFEEFEKYEHKVLGNIDGKLVPVPFNFKSLETLLPEQAEEIKRKIKESHPDATRVSIFDLLNDKDPQIREFGQYVYEKVFAYYTAKQWGIHPDNIDKSVINRVPVVLGYNELYFADTYQYMPVNGFTAIFENMLKSEHIEIRLNVNAVDVLSFKDGKIYFEGEEFKGKVIYSGALDELFGYCYGDLPYRSLNLVFESKNMDYFQPNSVINYTTSEDFTRISEFKYFSHFKPEGKTTILKEYSLPYDRNNPLASTPYYPIQNDENKALYEKYLALANQYPNLYLCGRLAQYRYYNMDAVIKQAFEIFEKIK